MDIPSMDIVKIRQEEGKEKRLIIDTSN